MIPLGEVHEFCRMPLESDFGVLVKELQKVHSKKHKKVLKAHGKKAEESLRNKGLWLMSI